MLARLLIVLGMTWAALGVWISIEPITAFTTWRKESVRVAEVDLQLSRPGLLWRRNAIVEVQSRPGTLARSINSAEARVGSRVTALLDPFNAGRVYLPDETSFWLVPVGFIGGGLFCALVGWTRQRNGGRPVRVTV
jgi:hypothetical protein